jgi:hypothetical protein
MSYYLSEAYSDLYNPRVDSNFDDNLRFIDSMLDEDIEEVVESLVWEICDYGNNLDESFNILSLAASDKIITEAYDELADEYLTESRSQVMARRAMAKQGLEREKGRLQSDLRKDARRARVDGAISRVKSAIAGARGGMGRATKNLGGAIAKARTDGKARLGQLLRRGVKATGRLLGSAGKAVQSVGQKSSASGLAARRAGKVEKSGQMSLVLEPSAKEKTGGALSKIGRGMRKAGVAVGRMTKSKSSSMSRSDYEKRKSERESAAREKVGKAFEPKGMTKPPLPPRPEAKNPVAALPPTGGTKGREMSPRRKEALAKIQKAAEGKTSKGRRFSAPGGIASPKRAHTDIQGQAGRFAQKALKEYEDILDSILDSLVEEKYAVDHESALNIFLNLSEDMVYDLTEEFLVD